MICRLLLTACLLCTSCSQHTSVDSSALVIPVAREIPEQVISQHPALSDAEKADCLARGGYIDLVTFNTEGCVIRTKDAGKPCSDSSECDGACLAPIDQAEGSPAAGTCASEKGMFFGCVNIVSKGKASGKICH